jgi:hypothetical protein
LTATTLLFGRTACNKNIEIKPNCGVNNKCKHHSLELLHILTTLHKTRQVDLITLEENKACILETLIYFSAVLVSAI